MHVVKVKAVHSAYWNPLQREVSTLTGFESVSLDYRSENGRKSLGARMNICTSKMDMIPSAKADPFRRRRSIWLSFRSGGVLGAAPLHDVQRFDALAHW